MVDSGTGQAPLLDIRDLRIAGESGGRAVAIVRGVTLSVARGEVLGLIGESGAGKSTVGLAAIGIVRRGCRVIGGSVVFDGIDLSNAGETARQRLRGARMTYVAQSAAESFNPAHRLIDQTIESASTHGLFSRLDARARAISLYRQLRLPDPDRFGERFPHQVSGGQLQRAMIAMAMMSQPDLIVFDEPTTALDVTTQIEVLAAARALIRTRAMAALYISHDLALVAQVADRIMVLKDGAMVEQAPTRAMLRAPSQAYTRSLLAARTLCKPSAPAVNPILRIERLSAGYGSRMVLRDVSIDIPRGRTVAVIGESGSGKTTLARVVAGLMRPSGGAVRFGDAILPSHLRLRDRPTLQAIQMIYQSADASLNPRHTVEKIIGRPFRLYRGLGGAAARAEVRELLSMVGLGERHLGRHPNELSGGEKQRVSIARAIAARPQVIICDEITSALDELVRTAILSLLLSLQRDLDIAYLFITHDFANVRAIADQVVVMQAGRIVEHGGRDAVLERPADPYTRLLLSSVPQMDPEWLSRVIAERDSAARRA
jgi:peptide/nickel transport system ATP-binding protein